MCFKVTFEVVKWWWNCNGSRYMVPILGSSRGESTASKIGFCLENVQERLARGTQRTTGLIVGYEVIKISRLLWPKNKFQPKPASALAGFEFRNLAKFGSGRIWKSRIRCNSTLNPAKGSGGVLWAPPAGSGAERGGKPNLVHFSLKIWYLVATILSIFQRIN